MDPKWTEFIQNLTKFLLSLNMATPALFATVTAIVSIIKLAFGSAPPLSEVIAEMKTVTGLNDERGHKELDRLAAMM